MASNSDKDRKHADRPARKPVTIDLEATEIASEADITDEEDKAQQASEPSAEAASDDGSAQTNTADGKSDMAAADTAVPTDDAPGKRDDAPDQTDDGSSRTDGADAIAADDPTENADPQSAPAATPVDQPAPRAKSGVVGWVAAALAGGIVATAGNYILQRTDVIPAPVPSEFADAQSALSDARKRIVALEGKIAVLADNAVRESATPESVASLEGRVTALETAPAAEPPVAQENSNAAEVAALGDRIAALETATNSTGEAVAGVSEKAEKLSQSVAGLVPLGNEVADLRKLVSTGASGADVALESLQSEIAAVREAVAAARGEITILRDRPAVDPALIGRLDAVDAKLAEQAENLAGVQAGGAARETDDTLTAAVTALSERVETAAKRVDAAEKSARDRVVAVDGLTQSADGLSKNLTSVTGRVDELATSIGKTSSRIEEIAATIAATGERIGQLETELGGVPAKETAARAVAVAALSDAVEAGRGYQTELAAVAKLFGDTVDLTALSAHAEGGIATRTTLIAQFGDVAKAMLATTSQAAPESSIVDRLWSNAQSAVRVRPVGDAGGTDTASVVARAEVLVGKGDFGAALSELDQLPDEAKTAGAAWMATVNARLDADKLVRKVSSDVLTMLGASRN